MRVLVTSTPGTGHVFPVLSLATALANAGHELLWVIASDGAELVRRHGFEVAIGGMNLQDRRATLESRLPEIMSYPARLRRGHLFAGFFAGGAARKMVDDLGPIIDRFRPDLVVREFGELGAAPHAVARAIPHVTVAFGGALPDYAVPLVLEELGHVWARLGLGQPSMNDVMGDAYFHPFSESMGHAADYARVLPMRPSEIPHVEGERPDWAEVLGSQRPAVYVTVGTTPVVATLAPWRPTFEALGSLDIDVVATIGPQFAIDDLGPIPTNVRVERFVPQEYLLDRVAVVVSHAGAGTLLAAAREGVPQLTIPTWADQWENSDAIAGTGAGILLEEDQRDTASIQTAVQQLLTDYKYGAAARRLATEIAAMPSPDDHVARLQELAGSG